MGRVDKQKRISAFVSRQGLFCKKEIRKTMAAIESGLTGGEESMMLKSDKAERKA